MSEEYWRSVPDAPNYLVSDLGRVARLVGKPDRGTGAWRIVKGTRNNFGYVKVCLGRRRQEYVHRLVAAAFIGPCPTEDDGTPYEVDHLDFDRTNNQLFNLRYLTHDDNTARQQRYGHAAEEVA